MNRKDKLALQRFRELSQRITEATEDIPLFENPERKQKRIAGLLCDYDAFVRYYFLHYAQASCGEFHKRAACTVLENANLKAVFEWARGHAKSTHFNIIIPLFLKARKQMRVMVLVGKSEKNAVTLLSDVQAELENNRRYIADFGEQMRLGSWEEGRFVTADDCAFFALGRGQSPRGLRHRQYRPDYIIMDDIDDDELCRNPDRVRKVFHWCSRALFFTTDMGRGRFILVGNRISQTSVLALLAEQPGFYHERVNALDESGQPSWKEKYTRSEIEDLINSLGYRNAQQELFNNPTVEGAVFKNEWLRYGLLPPLAQMDGLVSYCDPSFKSSATSDYKAIVTVARKGKQFFIVGAFVRKCSVIEMVRWWYDFHESLPPQAVCSYYMEAGFLQELIFDAFVQEGILRGYQLPLRPDKRAKPDKFARIEAVSPLFERGMITIDERLTKDPDTLRLTDQLLSFEKGSRSHDDGPDALEGATWILSRSGRRDTSRYLIAPRENRKF